MGSFKGGFLRGAGRGRFENEESVGKEGMKGEGRKGRRGKGGKGKVRCRGRSRRLEPFSPVREGLGSGRGRLDNQKGNSREVNTQKGGGDKERRGREKSRSRATSEPFSLMPRLRVRILKRGNTGSPIRLLPPCSLFSLSIIISCLLSSFYQLVFGGIIVLSMTIRAASLGEE